jgi:hypothetical protein
LISMGVFGHTLITAFFVLGVIWLAVLSGSFHKALAIFAGLAVVTVALAVLALHSQSTHVESAASVVSRDDEYIPPPPDYLPTRMAEHWSESVRYLRANPKHTDQQLLKNEFDQEYGTSGLAAWVLSGGHGTPPHFAPLESQRSW